MINKNIAKTTLAIAGLLLSTKLSPASTIDNYTEYPSTISASAADRFYVGAFGALGCQYSFRFNINQQLALLAEPGYGYEIKLYTQYWINGDYEEEQAAIFRVAGKNNEWVYFSNSHVNEYAPVWNACGPAPDQSWALLNNPLMWDYAIVTRISSPTGQETAIKTYGNKYVVAEYGGGGELNADRNSAGPWETFTLVDKNGGSLNSGDTISLATDSNYYVIAHYGGGYGADADRTIPYAHEEFKIRKLNSSGSIISGTIVNGSKVAFETYDGQHYLKAELGGGDTMNGDATAIGPWERFTLEFK